MKNYTIDQIQEYCDDYDITLTVKEVETTDSVEGTILSQSLSEGSKITKGDKITIELAKKPVEESLVPLDGDTTTNEQNSQSN